MLHEGFTAQARTLGQTAAWGAFLVGQAYAVAALLGFLSLASPDDPIGAPFLPLMALLLVFLAPFMVACMVAVHAYASRELRPYSMAALAFMVLAAGITACVNFVVLTASVPAGSAGSPWVASVLPYDWSSLAYRLDILAWDLFFALSMLLAAPVFWRGRLEKTLAGVMLLSGALSLAGLAGVPSADMALLSIGILGYGVAAPIVFLLLALVFGRTQPTQAG